MSKQFKKYMTPYGLGKKILSAVLLGYLLLFGGIMISEGEMSWPVLLIFGVGFLLSLIPLFKANSFIKQMETENTALIEADFARAYPFVKGKVRLGEYYVYGKNNGNLVKYSDIVQIYQYIHSTNGFEDQRQLKYVAPDGKTRTLCKLRLRGKSDSEVRDILTIILRKNPNVKIGK